MPRRFLLANALLFQVAWFGAVIGAGQGLPWIGLVAVAAVAVLHLTRAGAPARELVLLVLALAAGAVFETSMVQAGLLQFDGGEVLAGTAPFQGARDD